MAGKNKTSVKKSKGKLASFFSNPRNVVIVVFVLGFGLIGGYKVYLSSAWTDPGGGGKNPATVGGCKLSNVVLKNYTEGQCVSTYQRALNGINALSNTNWELLVTDGKFGSKSATATKGFQTYKGLSADGIVGPKTWEALYQACYTNAHTMRNCGM